MKSDINRRDSVIIFTDDQGYQDAGCLGARGFEAPTLDGMPTEGDKFTDFYSAAASAHRGRKATELDPDQTS